MQPLKNIVLFLAMLLGMQTLYAQQFSYVYIQGDKETPFYVKMDDQMLPRYGKNYNIISQLAPGPITIQVLFQQNVFPPQKFTIQVPENGYRGFLLMRKGDAFSLYDLQQQFYLPAGNSAQDDHAPAANSYIATNTPANTTKTNPDEITRSKPVKPSSNTSGNSPKFIDDIELNDKRTVQQNNTVATQPLLQQQTQAQEAVNNTQQPQAAPPAQTQTQTPPPLPTNNTPAATQPQIQQQEPPKQEVVNSTPPQTQAIAPQSPNNTPTQAVQQQQTTAPNNVAPVPVNTASNTPIINSDCPNPMSDDDFTDIYTKALAKTEKTRLKYLLSKLEKCFNTTQVKMLTETLTNEPERYAFLKQSYSRVSDQQNFPALESLLKTQEWRSYFRLIMP